MLFFFIFIFFLYFFSRFLSLFSVTTYKTYFTEKMVLKFPCKICNKAVANNHHTLQCRNCHLCVHIKCNRINFQTYKHLQNCSCTSYCLKCYEELIPFTTISNKELYQMNPGQKIKLTAITKMVSPIQDFIDQLNNAIMILCLKIYQLNTMSHMNLHRS